MKANMDQLNGNIGENIVRCNAKVERCEMAALYVDSLSNASLNYYWKESSRNLLHRSLEEAQCSMQNVRLFKDSKKCCLQNKFVFAIYKEVS